VFGGVRKATKSSWLGERVDFEVEWIDTSPSSTSSTTVLERRIRDGRIAALVVLDGLVGHKHVEPLIAAARQTSVPVAYAGRGGTASLEQAMLEIEEGLRQI
jgi:hypothetical protein